MGYKSELILILTGILQGLPLLLILFLFFISKLLKIYNNSQDIIALGFINNINLIIQGNIVVENNTRLNQAYNRYIVQAKRYSARFALDKYQLIYFIRKRRVGSNLALTVNIQGCKVKLEATLKALGVQVDFRLNQNDYIIQATYRGVVVFQQYYKLLP